jgi:hypothetical protein
MMMYPRLGKALWPMHRSAADVWVNAYSSTPTDVSFTDGAGGDAGSFNGSTSHIAANAAVLANTGPWTIFAKVRPAAQANMAIYAEGSSTDFLPNINLAMHFASPWHARFFLRRAAIGLDLRGGVEMVSGSDYTLAATSDDTTVRLYQQGVEVANGLVSSINGGAGAVASDRVRIGGLQRNAGLESPWNGLIYYCGTLTRALGPADILRIHATGQHPLS